MSSKRPCMIKSIGISINYTKILTTYTIYIRGCQKFGIKVYLKDTVSGVFEDLNFKISEGSDQNWSCPDSALLAVSV